MNDEIFKLDSQIQRLKRDNILLMKQIKNLNAELDHKMSKIKIVKIEQPDPIKTETIITMEIECYQKMCKNYEKEISMLKSQVSRKSGVENVVKLTDKYINMKNEYENLLKYKKQLQKQIKDNENKIIENFEKKEENYSKQEVFFIGNI